MQNDSTLPELPDQLDPDPSLVAYHNDLRLLRRIDLHGKWGMTILAVDEVEQQRMLRQIFSREDVQLVSRLIEERFDRISRLDLLAEGVTVYKKYLGYYNQYGGVQKCLSYEEHKQVLSVYFGGLNKKMGFRALTTEERERVKRAAILGLVYAPLMEGLFPDNPPQKPVSLELPEALIEHTRRTLSAAVNEAPRRRRQRRKKRRR